MTTDPAIGQLFAEYEKAFNELDFERQAHCFADVFMLAGPRGVIAERKPRFLKNANRAAAYYRSLGHTSARLISLEEAPLTSEFSMVKIHWGVTFRKTGDRLIEFDLSYLVQRTEGEPKIILAIAHQDEVQAMEELGLRPE